MDRVVDMIATCKHCGAPLVNTTGDRCPACGARTDAAPSFIQPPMNLAPESRVARPSEALAQASHAPDVLMTPASVTPPPKQVKQSRRRLWLALGLVGALALALCGGCAGTLYWAISSQLAPSQTGATILFQDTLLDSTSAWP